MTTDLPFKTGERRTVIRKDLPVMKCDRCSEYSIADTTFKSGEGVLERQKADWRALRDSLPEDGRRT